MTSLGYEAVFSRPNKTTYGKGTRIAFVKSNEKPKTILKFLKCDPKDPRGG